MENREADNLTDRQLKFDIRDEAAEATSNLIVNLDTRRKNAVWQSEIVSQLCRLLDLPLGWDSYKGRPLRHDTGMFALQLLNSVMNESIPIPSLVPVSSSGVQVEWHQNGLDIELYIAAPYECELSVEDHIEGDSIDLQLSSDFRELDKYVRRLVDFNRHLNNKQYAG